MYGATIVETTLAANEASAISWVREIVEAQYALLTDTGSFTTDLTDLVNAGLIDESVGSGIKNKYRFTLGPGPPDSSGEIVAFKIVAQPLNYSTSGCRCFFSDESGVIRYTTEDRPATADDPPL